MKEQISSLGFNTLLQKSWGIYRERMWLFLGLYILVPTLALVVLAVLAGLILLFAWLAVHVLHLPSVIFSISTWVIALAAVLFSLYFSFLSQTAFILAIEDSKLAWKQALHKAMSRVGHYFRSQLALSLIVLGGFLLFIVPGILFALWYCFIPFIVVSEKVSVKQSLHLSKQYVKGRIGKVLGYVLLMYLIAMCVAGFAAWVGSLSGIEAIKVIIQLVITLLWAPLPYIFSFTLYEELKATAVK